MGPAHSDIITAELTGYFVQMQQEVLNIATKLQLHRRSLE
jgi:hypothetical protein|tara:strand:- start:938 stop:1057 length:120 start_codon:yes stop_codon:yes gene_type:complete